MNNWKLRNCIVVFTIVILFGFTSTAFCQGNSRNPLELFQRDLHKRVSREQSARIAIQKYVERVKNSKSLEIDPRRIESLTRRASQADANNLAWLKQRIADHGFPTPSQIGEKSAEEWFLLILHADRDREFQKQCLEKMKQAADDWPERLVSLLELRSSLEPLPGGEGEGEEPDGG